jgi:hypothetical protein
MFILMHVFFDETIVATITIGESAAECNTMPRGVPEGRVQLSSSMGCQSC